MRGKSVRKSSAKLRIVGEITPDHLRCGPGSCPAALTLSDGKLLLIGKRLPQELQDQVAGRVAPDEFAILLDPAILANLHK